jgi:hypothetical protein
MAPLFAVVLAGIPARIYGAVSAALRERYPNQIVLRGKGAKIYASRFAGYSPAEVNQILGLAGDGIFGFSNRPMGFCRNPHRECAEKIRSKKNCGNDGGVRACGRQKPKYFLLIYQEANETEERRLLDAFYFSASLIRIPRASDDRREQTLEAAFQGVERALGALATLDDNFGCGAPCCLLPPHNFGRDELRVLLRKAGRADSGKQEYGQFRQQFFRNGVFEGRSRLGFAAATDHGTPGISADAKFALPGHYRLGCKFVDEFHWDVSPTNGDHFDGKTPIYCRIGGTTKPTAGHVNILVDDCLRGSK